MFCQRKWLSLQKNRILDSDNLVECLSFDKLYKDPLTIMKGRTMEMQIKHPPHKTHPLSNHNLDEIK